MLLTITILLLLQVLFNVINSRIDAFLILKNKTIAHAVNFGAYAVLVAVQAIYWHPVWWMVILFCSNAFFNRQVSFDIPLNLRRRKTDKTITWYYVSRAKPPKAITDRVEIYVFGYNGRAITLSYIFLLLVNTAALYILN